MGKEEKKENLEEQEIAENEEKQEETLTNEELIEKLNKDLEEEKKKSEEYFDHLKRNMAEFDNYKKRMAKEKESLYATIASDFLLDLLPILDNFEKAVEAPTTDETFKNGIDMIYNSLNDTLKKSGLEEIEALGKEFDPNYHEAVMHIEDDKFKEKEIVEVFRKGYKLGDRVIRHSMVKVAN